MRPFDRKVIGYRNMSSHPCTGGLDTFMPVYSRHRLPRWTRLTLTFLVLFSIALIAAL